MISEKHNIIHNYWHYRKYNSYIFTDYEISNKTRQMLKLFVEEHNIISYNVIRYDFICKKNWIVFIVFILDIQNKNKYAITTPISCDYLCDLCFFSKRK